MGLDKAFWGGKRVFITGHTGFKGAWLVLMLHRLGAVVSGYSLDPPTDPSLFQLADVQKYLVKDSRADVTDLEALTKALHESEAEVVFHLAAQPLVSEGYTDPVGTYATNVMGTVNMLEAVRKTPSVCAAVMITTDKCYENHEWIHPYREADRMGGADPYSNSKGCAELVTSAYIRSFFKGDATNAAVASVRAGNVVGGGDWAKDRLICDCIRSFQNNEPVVLRNPEAVRPWQHVLEPLTGYLLLAEKLFSNQSNEFEGGWNFGPDGSGEATVAAVAQAIAEKWGNGARVELLKAEKPFHESQVLRLDSTKAKTMLGWAPRWGSDEMLEETTAWYKVFNDGGDILGFTNQQIEDYLSAST